MFLVKVNWTFVCVNVSAEQNCEVSHKPFVWFCLFLLKIRFHVWSEVPSQDKNTASIFTPYKYWWQCLHENSYIILNYFPCLPAFNNINNNSTSSILPDYWIIGPTSASSFLTYIYLSVSIMIDKNSWLKLSQEEELSTHPTSFLPKLDSRGSQWLIPGPVAVASSSPGNLIETQILAPCPPPHPLSHRLWALVQ